MAYLYQVNQTYYFRIRIPKDLLQWFNRTEFKRSLRTKSLTSARRMLTIWAAKTEKLFTTIRAGLLTGVMNGKQIKRLVEEYIGFTLKKDDETRLDLGMTDSVHFTEDGPVRITDRAEFDPDVETAIDELEANKFDHISRRLNEFLSAKGIQVDQDSYDYKVLCRDIAYAHINQIHQINVDRDMGVFTDKYYLDGATSDPKPKKIEDPQNGPHDNELLLSELTEKYLAEKQAREKCSQGTLDANRRYFSLFIELLGDCGAKGVTRDQLVDCLNTMKRIPSRRDVIPEYKGKSIQELLELDSVRNPLSTQTIKNHISTLSSCFKWAVLNGHLDRNVAEGLTPKDNRSKRDQRQAYTPELLTQMVEALHAKQKARGKSPDRWLIPLVALFSGMRIEEICKLRKDDVRKMDDVWCFDVNGKVKTQNSERIVPVHPKLIELGFLDYHQTVEQEQLWPRLKQMNGRFSHKWGQWFQSFNKRYITKDGRYVFHSLRHNFTNGLKQQGVQEQVIAEMVGHSRGSITMETYGKSYEPKVLYKEIQKLEYRVDLSILKWTVDCGIGT